jgi:hypothetical protein
VSDEVALDPVTVARIVRRASELAGPEVAPFEEDGCIDQSALLAAAAEVGLPAVAVQRSIAWERLGDPPRPRLADRILGESTVVVDDELTGAPEEVLAAVDAWLVHGHHLRRDRLRGGRGEWSKRDGLVGLTVRRLRTATGEGRLGEHRSVIAEAHAVGNESSLVRVSVDRSAHRRRAASSGAIVGLGGTGAVIVVAAATAPLLVVAAPVAILGGLGVARRGRAGAARTANEVERMLEAVADQSRPTRLRSEVARRLSGRERKRPGRDVSSKR